MGGALTQNFFVQLLKVNNIIGAKVISVQKIRPEQQL